MTHVYSTTLPAELERGRIEISQTFKKSGAEAAVERHSRVFVFIRYTEPGCSE
jgi:hypothetical protein